MESLGAGGEDWHSQCANVAGNMRGRADGVITASGERKEEKQGESAEDHSFVFLLSHRGVEGGRRARLRHRTEGTPHANHFVEVDLCTTT